MNLFNDVNLRLWEKGSDFVRKDTDQEILNAVRHMCKIRKIILHDNNFYVDDSFETKRQKISENLKKRDTDLHKYFEENRGNMDTFIWLYDRILPLFYDDIQEIIASEINKEEKENMPQRKCKLNDITILGKVECLFFLSQGDVLRTCTIYSSPSLLFDSIERKVNDYAQVLSKDKVQQFIDSYPLHGDHCVVEFDLEGCLKAAEEGYDWPINAGLVCLIEE